MQPSLYKVQPVNGPHAALFLLIRKSDPYLYNNFLAEAFTYGNVAGGNLSWESAVMHVVSVTL